jgi:hypothetical protein
MTLPPITRPRRRVRTGQLARRFSALLGFAIYRFWIDRGTVSSTRLIAAEAWRRMKIDHRAVWQAVAVNITTLRAAAAIARGRDEVPAGPARGSCGMMPGLHVVQGTNGA